MPYDDSAPRPESSDAISPDRPRLLRRSTLAVAAAVLAPTCLAGWVLVNVLSGSGSGAAAETVQGAPLPSSGTAASHGAAPTHGDAKAAPGTATPPPVDPSAEAAGPDPRPRGPLAGRTVVLDPGHNPGNFRHTTEINRRVDIGTNRKECDTTGTTTNAGYQEAQFTLDVTARLKAVLAAQGAKVVVTHTATDRAWGPCIDERARIGNTAHADAVVSIHADGSSAGNRGFHVILPAKVHAGAADTTPITGPSRVLGTRIAGNFARVTGMRPSNYVGGGTGLVVREDLGGLNLSTRPKVFIECGNMRDATDAALLTSPAWRQKAAQGIADGIRGFLGG
ncbi:N-acetylmuramoyl-L-alanine amidase [Streptomyces sp. NPDC089919]|uniref:N-acetylmuramoyl-L-alanine amidase n=1 Tax=Streptomyces sp. NPDC089919 TaxID=3155188 RepID=UPI00341C7074